jgi:hypothetical protein
MFDKRRAAGPKEERMSLKGFFRLFYKIKNN